VLAIHLRRAGAKKDPHYRVVVSDSRKARDGAVIEILGHYHPRNEPAKVVLDVNRAKEWIAQGAQPSDTVKSLMRKVEAGAIEHEPSVSPSRHRDAAKHAGIRAAVAKPAPEAEEPAVKAAADEAVAEEAPAEKVAEEDKE
jgi:small subunit ribosomal protein S16